MKQTNKCEVNVGTSMPHAMHTIISTCLGKSNACDQVDHSRYDPNVCRLLQLCFMPNLGGSFHIFKALGGRGGGLFLREQFRTGSGGEGCGRPGCGRSVGGGAFGEGRPGESGRGRVPVGWLPVGVQGSQLVSCCHGQLTVMCECVCRGVASGFGPLEQLPAVTL